MPLSGHPARRVVFLAIAAIVLDDAPVLAQDQPPSFTLTLRDGKWEPEELQVPAGQKFELRVTNATTRGAEFESKDMRREKVIPPGQSVVINAGPLRPGTYEFFDDFRPTTRGRVVAR
jgi:hypothetical protein